MTDIVMLALISTSNRNGGRGAIIASTMPSTAIGTPNSIQFAARAVGIESADPVAPLGTAPTAFFIPSEAGGRAGCVGSRTGLAIYFLLGFISLKMYANTS